MNPPVKQEGEEPVVMPLYPTTIPLQPQCDFVQLYRSDIAQKILIFYNDIQQIIKYVTARCQQLRLAQHTCIVPCLYKSVHYTMYRIFDHFFVALMDGLSDDPQKAFLVRRVIDLRHFY